MAFVRNPQGALVSIPDKDLDRALRQGYTPAKDEEVATAKSEAARKVEAGEHPVAAAAQGFIKGAVDTALLPIRTVGNVAEAVAGPNALSDTTSQMTGENALRGASYLTQGSGPTPSAPYMQGKPYQGDVEQHMQDVQTQARANPLASGAGELAGSVAGFGPLGTVAGAAGGIAEGAGIISKAANIAAEAAVIGGAQGVDEAAQQAHHEHSYLTGQQALAAGGLGTLFAGGLLFAGKGAGKLFEMRRGRTVPNLELPETNTQAVERVAKEQPQLGEAETEAAPFNLTQPGTDIGRGRPAPWNMDWEKPVEPRRVIPPERAEAATQRETVGKPAPEPPATERAPLSKPAKLVDTERAPLSKPEAADTERAPLEKPTIERAPLEKPITEPDPSFAGGDDLEARLRASLDEKAFPRRTRYARGARDVFEPEYANHDLPLGGKGAVEPEELRAALNGEALNSQRRAEKVAKLMEVTPEGASPEWVRNMTPKQRDALCDYIGVPKSSAETWKAFEDAVAEREGYEPNQGRWVKSGETWENYAGQAPPGTPPPQDALAGVPAPPVFNAPNPGAVGELPAVPEAYQPNAPTPGNYNPPTDRGLIGTLPEIPLDINAPTPGSYNPQAGADKGLIGTLPEIPLDINAPTPGSYQPSYGPTTAGADVIGINPADAAGAVAAPAKAWTALLAESLKHQALRAGAGALFGGAVGGLPGLAVGAVGGVVAKAAGGLLVRLAKKGASLGLDATEMLIRTGQKVPGDWSGAMAQHAGKYGEHFFMGKDDAPEQAYTRRYKELQALNANNGSLIRDRVANSYGHLATVERGALQATVDTAHAGVDYLLQNAPKVQPNLQSLTPLADSMKPTKSDIDAYARVYDAVMHPVTVLRDIANGSVTSEQVRALKTVYPRWYQENVQTPLSEKLRLRDAAGMGLRPAERRVVDTLLEVHSGVDNDAFVQQYSATFAQALSNQQQPPVGGSGGKGGTGRSLRRASTIAPRMQTETSTFLGGKQ